MDVVNIPTIVLMIGTPLHAGLAYYYIMVLEWGVDGAAIATLLSSLSVYITL